MAPRQHLAHHQHWNVHDLKKSRKPLKKGEETPSFQQWPITHSQGGARPPFFLTLWNKQKHRGAHSKRWNALLPRKHKKNAQTVQTIDYSSEQALYSKETNARPDELISFHTFCHLRTMNITRWHKERKKKPRSTSTPCLTSKLSRETGQPNKTQQSSPFAFLLLRFPRHIPLLFVSARPR